MTEKTPIPQEEITQWKNKYLDKGLPEALLDDLIADMNLEYEASIALEHPERLADLTVSINDLDTETDCFYRVTLNWGGIDIQSRGIADTSYKFLNVSCVQIHIEVFKITNDGTQCKGYGYLLLNHSTDETATVSVYSVNSPQEISIATGIVYTETTTNALSLTDNNEESESTITSIAIS